MIDPHALLLTHPHGDHAAPMTEVGTDRAPDLDEERTWLHRGRIFRCTECNEEVVVGQPASSTGPERGSR